MCDDRSVAHEYSQYDQWEPSYDAAQSTAFQAQNATTTPTRTPAYSQYAAPGQPLQYDGFARFPVQEWHQHFYPSRLPLHVYTTETETKLFFE